MVIDAGCGCVAVAFGDPEGTTIVKRREVVNRLPEMVPTVAPGGMPTPLTGLPKSADWTNGSKTVLLPSVTLTGRLKKKKMIDVSVLGTETLGPVRKPVDTVGGTLSRLTTWCVHGPHCPETSLPCTHTSIPPEAIPLNSEDGIST